MLISNSIRLQIINFIKKQNNIIKLNMALRLLKIGIAD